MLVLMTGLPASGKTTLAREVAQRINGTVLNKDPIRSALFEARDLEYSTAQDDFVMEIMLQTAAYLFAKDPARVIFFDGRPFSRNSQIERVKQFASAHHQPWRIVECTCSEASARMRIESQIASGEHLAGNRNFDLYLAVRARFEPIAPPKTVIDTDASLDTCLQQAFTALRD